MSRRPPPAQLSARQRAILERLSRSRTLPKRLAERVAFVLGAAAGKTAVELAQQMGLDPQRARRWRKRWLKACEQFERAEAEPVDGILARRALKRASFKSTEELREAILAFIAYFNELLAKPFGWTYTGRPLAA